MSMLGNATYTGVENLAGQLPNLNVASLEAVNVTVVTLIILGNLTINGNITVAGDLTVDGQILASEGTFLLPSYSFTSDPDTGIYHLAANQIGFSTDGTIRAAINSAGLGQLGVTNGTALLPSYTFLSDTNTGMHRPGADTVGISTGGQQNFTMTHTSGLTIGQPGFVFNPAIAIKRQSTLDSNSWEDGHMGNSSQLIFTATDFICANPTPGAAVGALTSGFVNICNNSLGWAEMPGGRFGTPSLCTATAADVVVATKLIPKGFQIKDTDRITIHGLTPSLVATLLAVACRNVNNPAGVLGNTAQIATYTLNSPALLTNITGLGGTTPIGDGTSMIIIYLDPGVQLTTANGITGATITMSRV